MSEVKKRVLNNGLVLLGEPRAESCSASIGFFVRTGARDEVGPESGISHFLEHMMFKGTKRRSALDITYELGSLGAQANAYTSEESTVFYSTVVPEKFSAMQELLTDMLRPALNQDDFDTEKKVILEEIALYQDKPQFVMFEQSTQSFFDGHPAGNSVLGTTKSITDGTLDQMLSYFQRRYSPANMSLIATGNFDWERFCSDAEKYCSEWKPFEAGRKTLPYKRVTPDAKTFTKEDLQQGHLLLMRSGVSAQDPRRYAMAVLGLILGDSGGSKLYWELVESGLCEVCVFDDDQKDGTGTILIYAVTEPSRIESVKAKIMQVISDPLSFSEEDLVRAKRKIATRIVLSGELPIGRLMSIGNDWLYRDKVTTLEEIKQQILSVTKEDISKLLNEIPLTDWSTYTLLPK